MSVLPVGIGSSGGYTIDRSVRLRSSASAYFNRTFGSPTSNLKYTMSMWVKRGKLGVQQSLFASYNGASEYAIFYFSTDDKLNFIGDSATAGRTFGLTTAAVFRDPSAWYHVVAVFDSANATVANRCLIYVNGVSKTLTGTTVPLNAPTYFNTNGINGAVGQNASSGHYFDGYLTEINFIDGQALTPSSFGEYDADTGVWKPKKYVGTYGANGFYLNFSDNTSTTTLGYDYSGNGNNWTANNISLTSGVSYDSMTDVPTLTSESAANYCTLNPLAIVTNQTGTYSDGNLTFTSPSSTFGSCASTMAIPSSGKWYAEVTATSSATYWWFIGLCEYSVNGGPLYSNTNAVSYYSGNGNKYVDNVASSYGASYTTNDVIGIAVDADSNTVTFYKNNVSQGSISHSVAGLFFSQGDASTGGSTSAAWNFGQRPFSYTPPSGFKALNTQNLPDSTIPNGRKYFDATTYTGNGVNNRAITGVGFQPDLVWTKARSAAYDALITDAVRGSGKSLTPSSTGAEVTNNGNGYVSAFNADGFTLTQGVSSIISVNESGQTYVGWQWKKGATPGFDIVTFTSTGTTMTVNHSLGVTPDFVILKRRDSSDSWYVNHSGFATRINNWLALNSTAAISTLSTTFTGFSSTTVSFGGGLMVNGATYVMYAFANVAGFSKFGSYTGNGSTDGPFVFTNFRPKFVLIKRTDAVGQWGILDTARNTYNTLGNLLIPSSSAAEDTVYLVDLLSNGFKPRVGAGYGINDSGGTYVYACFAENPFKNSLAR